MRKTISRDTIDIVKQEIFSPNVARPARAKTGSLRKGNAVRKTDQNAEAETSTADQASKAYLLRELDRKVTARDGNDIVEVPLREAIIRAQIMTALKGSPLAQRHLIDRIESLEQEAAVELARRHTCWNDYQARWRERIASAEAGGEPAPNPLPHPDDIVIEPGKPVRFRGPLNEEEAKKFEETCRVRDILILQNELDWRLYDGRADEATAEEPGGALLVAMLLDRLLPPRMRCDDTRTVTLQMRYQGIPKRRLLKEVHQSWQAIGRHVRRGKTMPSEQRMYEILGQICCHSADLHSGKMSALDFVEAVFGHAGSGDPNSSND